METAEKVTVKANINATVSATWHAWIDPVHIIKWNNPSLEWHTPRAVNDLRVGQKFMYRMEAKDGSMGFDFGGRYDEVETNKLIKYTLDDDRRVVVNFFVSGGITTVVQTFEAENENAIEHQRSGWQGILDSFKNYVESIA